MYTYTYSTLIYIHIYLHTHTILATNKTKKFLCDENTLLSAADLKHRQLKEVGTV